MRIPFGWLLVAGVVAGPLQAQVQTLDEGTLTITRNGARIGRETFSIRKSGGAGGGFVQAQATVTIDGRRIDASLRTDEAGSVLEYTRTEATGGARAEVYKGRVMRGLYSATTQTGNRGETRHEFPVGTGVQLVDGSVFHHAFFVARRGPGSITAIIPERNAQVTLVVEGRGTESLMVGETAIMATHLVVRVPGDDARDVWVDARGRLLKIAIASTGIVAAREDPPE